jgi:hypothetical protein
MAAKTRGEAPMSTYVRVRLSAEEKQRLRDDADLAALTISDFMRRRAFGKPVVAEVDRAVIRELHRLGGLLKHIHVTSGGSYSKQTAAAITDLRTYVRRLLAKADVVDPAEVRRIVDGRDPAKVVAELRAYLKSTSSAA